MNVFCYKCRKELSVEGVVARTSECPHCYASIRCCMMCQFYDKSCYNECREPSAERVTDKEKANFCDYFKLAFHGPSAEEEKSSLLDEANALFKN